MSFLEELQQLPGKAAALPGRAMGAMRDNPELSLLLGSIMGGLSKDPRGPERFGRAIESGMQYGALAKDQEIKERKRQEAVSFMSDLMKIKAAGEVVTPEALSSIASRYTSLEPNDILSIAQKFKALTDKKTTQYSKQLPTGQVHTVEGEVGTPPGEEFVQGTMTAPQKVPLYKYNEAGDLVSTLPDVPVGTPKYDAAISKGGYSTEKRPPPAQGIAAMKKRWLENLSPEERAEYFSKIGNTEINIGDIHKKVSAQKQAEIRAELKTPDFRTNAQKDSKNLMGANEWTMLTPNEQSELVIHEMAMRVQAAYPSARVEFLRDDETGVYGWYVKDKQGKYELVATWGK